MRGEKKKMKGFVISSFSQNFFVALLAYVIKNIFLIIKNNINCSTITLASSFSIPSFSAASTIFEDISKYQAGPLP